VAEEVVLAADLLVEDLAAEAADSGWIWAEASLEVAQWRLVTDSVNIVSQKLQIAAFFCDYLSVITCEKH
jgi:hypothetical protein